jgi:C-terminal processing protease CtpA/Prc
MVLHSFCNGQLRYAYLDEHVGYLRILSFSNYSSTGDDERALNGALDQIFSDPTLRALIIDLRVNLGGDDRLGLIVASRLAQQRYPAYRVETQFASAAQEVPKVMTVVPSGSPQFSGPVVLLIGPLTMSAGEIFAAALMGRTPHITMIGEPTQGLVGGVLGRRLPNGWVFGLPNTRIVLPDGRSFEGKGIPPDVRTADFSEGEGHTKRDPALAAAIEILRHQLSGERPAAH